MGNSGILSSRSTSSRAYERASATQAKESRRIDIVLPAKSIVYNDLAKFLVYKPGHFLLGARVDLH
jgi:hypothetical protein